MEDKKLSKNVKEDRQKLADAIARMGVDVILETLGLWMFCFGFGFQFRWQYVVGLWGGEILFGRFVDQTIRRNRK